MTATPDVAGPTNPLLTCRCAMIDTIRRAIKSMPQQIESCAGDIKIDDVISKWGDLYIHYTAPGGEKMTMEIEFTNTCRQPHHDGH